MSTTALRRRLLSAGTHIEQTSGEIGQIVGVPGKPFPTAIQSQKTVFPLALDEEAIVRAGR